MPSHFVAWTQSPRRHGLTFPEARFYCGGVPTAKIAAMLIAEAGLTLDPGPRAREGAGYFEASRAAGRQTDRGGDRDCARAPPRAADGDGVGEPAPARHPHARALGITDWFAAVVAAEDTARHKPEPDVFLEAARRLGVARRRLHRLRGHRHGPRAARRAGMTAVDVRPLIRDPERVPLHV